MHSVTFVYRRAAGRPMCVLSIAIPMGSTMVISLDWRPLPLRIADGSPYG